MGFLNFPLRRAQLQQSSSAAMQDFLDEAFEFPVVKAGGWGRSDLDVLFANGFVRLIVAWFCRIWRLLLLDSILLDLIPQPVAGSAMR